MKILIFSPSFFPIVGGLELMAKILAEEFCAMGHQTTLVTNTPAPVETPYDFEIVRTPTPIRLLRLVIAADVVLHLNLSLKGIWPLVFVRRPLVIAHYGPYRRPDGTLGLRDRLKYKLSELAENIACSAAVKADLPPDSRVIPNAYDDRIYRVLPGERSRDVIFVGRFVSDKGVDLLLNSLVDLRQTGLEPTVTIVGLGPDEDQLREYCREQHLLGQVVFAGKCIGPDVVTLINRHRIMVVPSRSEGFGIVALDGIACGCVVIASDTGGLPEAIGDCGITFRNGDVGDLSRQLIRALSDSSLRNQILASRERHLNRFSRREVARRYINVIKTAAARVGSG